VPVTDTAVVSAGPADAPLIAALEAEWPGTRWGAGSVRRLLELPGSVAFLARREHDGAAVGYVLCLPAGDALDVATLAILPELRRRGIASSLMAAVLARAGLAGYSRVLLEVDENNQPALALYSRFGFVPIARRPKYYAARGNEEPADALVLEKYV
jgi:ribosomal-protein-alanine N-acetyltransferase